MENKSLFPQAFVCRMKQLLGDDYASFEAVMAEEDSVHAFILNPNKPMAAHPLETVKKLEPVSYVPSGYICEGEGWGAHALHRAGAYYMQDPAAMGPVAAAPIEAGWKVLDLCAAPGGKTAQLSYAVGENGWVVSNEMNPTRARALFSNIERLGLKNVMVMNADGKYTAGLFPSYFDLVLLDAPCSGEGMFRKNPEAVAMWNEGNVTLSASRQRDLLEAASAAVKPGGWLLYSTCTFAPEEDEGQLAGFLERHSDFSLAPVNAAVEAATVPGMKQATDSPMELTRRFYPHRTRGEGQFVGLMRKEGCSDERASFHGVSGMSAAEQKVVEAFLKDTLTEFPEGVLKKLGDRIILLPREELIPKQCVLSAGVFVGEIQKGRLIPHHQFFSAFGRSCKRTLELSGGTLPWNESSGSDPRLVAYLHGETLTVTEMPNGWGAVLVDGCALGGFKAVDGILKNHYPKGLRI